MAAQNIAENDEEIIDLTELIEKGEVPANDAAVADGQAEETLSDQIRSLNDLPQEADEEIDALLAQMEVKGDRAPAGETAKARRVDPNEELDMPGMGEVDKLLDTLDIPPQPHEHGATGLDPSHPADAATIDGAVDDLLNSLSPTPRASSNSDQKPDVYDLLSEATGPDAAGNALPDDLDALLHNDAPDAQPAPDPSAPRRSEPDLAADLDDLLAAAEKPVPPSDLAAPKAPDLTADLDSLLAAMDAEQDAEPHGAAPAPPSPARPQDQTQSAEAAGAQAENAAPTQAAPAAAQAAAMADMPEADLENAPHIPPETGRQSEAEPVADLDSLLAAMDAEQDAEPHGAAPAPPSPARPQDQTQSAEAAAAQAQNAAPTQAAPAAAQAAAMADMPEADLENAPHIPPETGRQSEAEPAADLDSLLAAMGGEQDAPPALEDAPLALQEEEERATATDQESRDETGSTHASAPHESEQSAAEPRQDAIDKEQTCKPERAAELDLDMLFTGAAQQSTAETNAPEQALDAAASPRSFMDGDAEPAIALDDVLIAAGPEQTSSLAAEQDAAPLPAQQTPVGDGLQRGPEAARADAEELVSLGVRLRHCEAELADARARIAALERASGAAAASLEDLLRDGSPLHDRFAGLIASSVREALKCAPTGISEQVLDERLQAVSLSNKSISARMDALETRLDHLEPRFNTQVEKAAAGAAARILREEITKLVAN